MRINKAKEVEKGDQSPVSHTSSEKADTKSSASLPSSKLNERDAEAPTLSNDSIAKKLILSTPWIKIIMKICERIDGSVTRFAQAYEDVVDDGTPRIRNIEGYKFDDR